MNESHPEVQKSEQLKMNSQDEEDRISDLHDSILFHILSFLPTKEAVGTCILSSRWKIVWTSLANLHFDDRLCLEYKRTNNLTNDACFLFQDFVNRVLLLSYPSNINKFSLRCFNLADLSCFNFWVSTAITRKVRVIKLKLKRCHHVELPDSIYTCKTLEVLKLRSDFTIKIPPSGICFPNVKILYIKIYHPGNSLTEKLFAICPVLDDLSIEVCLDNVLSGMSLNLNVSSLTLTSLVIIIKSKENGFRSNDHRVMIRAPNLKRIFIKDKALASYMVHELHCLTQAHIDMRFFKNLVQTNVAADRVLQILKGITKTKDLFLYARTITALDSFFGDIFPAFPNVTYLDSSFEGTFPAFPNVTYLEVRIGEDGWRLLPVILNSLPNLETFFFKKDYRFIFNKKEFGWIESQSVPLCLLQHVKKIIIESFVGQKDELGLVEYLLQKSEVLNTMIIRPKETASQENLCKKLLMFQRGSKACQVSPPAEKEK